MLKIDNKIHLYWADIELLTDKLCEEIVKIPNVTHISGLSRGGLIPAVMVSHKLNLPYTDKILWSDDKVIRNTLLIDDICDSGETLDKFVKKYQTLYSFPFNLKTAVLHYKPHTSCFEPTFHSELYLSDYWLVYPWEKEDSKTIQDYKSKVGSAN